MSTIRIDANGPFHHAAARAMLAAHAIPGVEEFIGDRYRRVVEVDGDPVLIAVTLDRAGVSVDLGSGTAPSAAARCDQRSLVAMIRRWFDLDTDLRAIDRALASDPALAPMITARPGLRLVGFPDEFDAVATTVIGQQVSLAAARTFAGRLVAAHGEAYEHLRRFPTADRLARLNADEIRECTGLTRARALTLREVSRRWADGPILTGLSSAEAHRLLLDIPGIGPWSADYLLVRALRDPDAFAPGDLVARRALGGIDQRAAAVRAEAWAPYRAYALLHLWTDDAYL